MCYLLSSTLHLCDKIQDLYILFCGKKRKENFFSKNKMEGAAQLGIITLIVILVAAWIFFNYYPLPPLNQNNPQKVLVADSLSKMKRLWTERSYLTRASSVENTLGFNGSGLTDERILANGQQIGRNLGNLYGREAGEKLNAALTDYHQDMFNLLKGVRHHRDITHEYNHLKSKGQELVRVLSDTCPCLEASKLKPLVDSHIDHFMKTIVHTSRDENLASMSSFDAYNKCTQELVDYLDEGIWCDLIGHGPRHL